MVGGLLAHFDLAQLAVSVLCGGAQHLDEQLLGGKMRAACRGEVAAPGQKLHGPVVDLLVAPHGVFHRAAGFGEGRRVEDDEIVGMAFFFEAGQKLEGILAEEIHVGQAVALRVPLGHGDGVGADVRCRDPGCATAGCVEGKAAGVGEAVQHGVAGGEAGDCPAVVLLVEEEAGLLAVLEIDVVVDAVLADLGLGGGGVDLTRQLEPALALLEALFGTQGLVVPLVDAVDGLAVGPQDFGEEGEEDGLQLLHADAEGLGDEDVVEAVHGQAGELVGLAEDDPAGREVGRFEDSLAVGPGVLDAAAPEAGVEGVVGVAGDEADADLALERDEAGAKVSALRAHHVGEGSVLRLCLRELEDVVLVHPRMPAHEAGFGFFAYFINRIAAF